MKKGFVFWLGFALAFSTVANARTYRFYSRDGLYQGRCTAMACYGRQGEYVGRVR